VKYIDRGNEEAGVDGGIRFAASTQERCLEAQCFGTAVHAQVVGEDDHCKPVHGKSKPFIQASNRPTM
jgi:hypothetical protein